MERNTSEVERASQTNTSITISSPITRHISRRTRYCDCSGSARRSGGAADPAERFPSQYSQKCVNPRAISVAESRITNPTLRMQVPMRYLTSGLCIEREYRLERLPVQS